MPANDEEDPWEGWNTWRATKLYRRWYDRTQVGEPNDFVIAVTASSHTGVSGTGKSTVLTVLGQEFDTSPDGFDAELKATVDVRELAYDRLPDVPDHSAVIADEIQGLQNTHGLDSRRGMRQSSIDAVNAILANRDKSLTVILGAQLMPMLDKRLFGLVDAWLLIRKEPSDPEGPLMTHHKMYVEDYDFRSPNFKTPALEDLTWPRVPHDDPDYQHLTKLKHQNKRERYDDGEEVDPLANRNALIRSAYEMGVSQPKIAKEMDLDQSQISRIVNS